MSYNILVVDDSETMRAVISRTLKMAEVPIKELFQAANGKEAIKVLEQEWIDLVFADINMPEMNGVEMVEHMAADGLLSTIPVVIVSTEGSQTRIDQLKEKGVRAYLRKPFSPEQIKNVVTEIMGESDESVGN